MTRATGRGRQLASGLPGSLLLGFASASGTTIVRKGCVMKKLFALTALLFGICTGTLTQAQTKSDTFTFGSAGVIGTTQSSNCSPITAWDDVVNAYPQDMGEVCFNFYPDGFSGMDIPFQLGYPNNGFLLDQTPFTWGPMVSTSSNTYTQTGTADYTGYGAGVVVTVTIDVVVTQVRSCGHGICHYFPVHTLTGGTGVVTLMPPICGDGIIESGEQCDDGNTTSGDGCSSQCQIESCFTCVGQPSICTPAPAGTACDDGNACTVGETCNGSGVCGGFTSCRINSTCNVCGQVCTQPQPGVCKCG